MRVGHRRFFIALLRPACSHGCRWADGEACKKTDTACRLFYPPSRNCGKPGSYARRAAKERQGVCAETGEGPKTECGQGKPFPKALPARIRR